MAKPSISDAYLEIKEIANHYNDVEHSLRYAFANSSLFIERFSGLSHDEIRHSINNSIDEEGRLHALSILSAIEAMFRVDYLQRVHKKQKDSLSRAFRDLYKENESRVSLEDEIFELWKRHTTVRAELISDLRSAFKFRHWLAHGRYWVPKFGRNFDYFEIYELSVKVVSAFPFNS